MIEFPKAKAIQDSIYTGTWTDRDIPVYTVFSMHGLNQLIGYVKYKNAGNGTVLYRGQCELYPSMKASIRRDPAKFTSDKAVLEKTLAKAIKDEKLKSYFHFNDGLIKGWELYHSLAVESVMQHYGAKTFCMDFVDNHWSALWFGLYKWNKTTHSYSRRTAIKDPDEDKEINHFIKLPYKKLPIEPKSVTKDDLPKRDLSLAHKLSEISGKPETFFIQHYIDMRNKQNEAHWKSSYQKVKEQNRIVTSFREDKAKGHMYLLLYVADTNCPTIHGVSFGTKTYTMDLRKMLPSVFLRPFSQHGWIVRGQSYDYDFESRIACVIRINIDLVTEMLGEGSLLSIDNFFPSQNDDKGYHVLLERQRGTVISSSLPKIFPKNTIDTSFIRA